jgi:hypothetical protein
MKAGTGHRSRQNGVPSQCASQWRSGRCSVRACACSAGRAPARVGTAAAPLQWPVLTQKVHSAPITQQAEKLASHAQRESDVPVNFS